MNYREIELAAYRDVLTGRLSKESRDVLEGLAFLVLFLVGGICGALVEQRLSAIERQQAAYEARQRLVDERLKKMDAVMFGAIE